MKKLLYFAGASIAAILSVVSCSGQAEWKLDGQIEGASDTAIILEAANPAGYWYTLDTIAVNGKGKFNAGHAAPQFPDIYRLNYGGNYIYFPIDSIERLSLKANAGNFSTGYELSGSDNATMITEVEQQLNTFLKNHTSADLDTAKSIKRSLSAMLLDDPSSIVAFYIVNKQIDGRRIFRTDNRQELGLIGAVANAYAEKRPNDPRTQYLKDLWIRNKSRFSNTADTVMANEIHLIDIDALDNNGKQQRLSDIAAKNKLVILNFTSYAADYSQPLNIVLRDLYNANHGNGMEIYQLGFGNSEFEWRVAAGNQPWITVFNGATDLNLKKYNVGNLPALFIIYNGELVERVTSVDNLKSAVRRYL